MRLVLHGHSLERRSQPHFIGRAAKATRWLETSTRRAVAAMPSARNTTCGYTLFMLDFYGREFVDELKVKEEKVLSPSQVRQLAEDAIEYYSKEF